jgi:hypothetical protein
MTHEEPSWLRRIQEADPCSQCQGPTYQKPELQERLGSAPRKWLVHTLSRQGLAPPAFSFIDFSCEQSGGGATTLFDAGGACLPARSLTCTACILSDLPPLPRFYDFDDVTDTDIVVVVFVVLQFVLNCSLSVCLSWTQRLLCLKWYLDSQACAAELPSNPATESCFCL